MISIQQIKAKIEKTAPWLVLIMSAIYTLIFSAIGLMKYHNFGYNALDLGIINQVFYNSSLGNFFAASIQPPTYLGDHFSPIIFIFLPLYRLCSAPPLLLILQTVTLAACAWPIYLIAKKVLGKSWAVIVVAAWLLNPFVQNINLFEFSFLPFAVFFIFWIFYFYQQKKFRAFLLFCFLAMLVREDVALVILGFGLLAMLDKKNWRWWLLPILGGITYFIFAVKFSGALSPSGNYKFLLYYAWLGNSIPEILKNAALHPWLILFKLFSLGSWVVAFSLLLPTVFLPLFKPKYLIISALIYLQLATGTTWQGLAIILYTQYVNLLLPGIIIAAIYGAKELENFKPKLEPIKLIFAEKNFLRFLAGLTIIYAAIFFGPLSSAAFTLMKNGWAWPGTQNKWALLNLIPPQAPIAASYAFLGPLSGRRDIASLNYAFLGKQQFMYTDYILPPQTQYLAVDFNDLITYQLQYGMNPMYKNQYLTGRRNWPSLLSDFGLIAVNDTTAIFEKSAAAKFQLIATDVLPPAGDETEITIDSQIKYLGFKKIGNECQLFWETNLPLQNDYQLQVSLIKKEKVIYQKIYPFAYDLLDAPELTGKKNIQTNYWFGDNASWPRGDFDLTLNVIRIKKGSIEINGLRGSDNTIYSFDKIGPDINLGKITN